MSVPRLSRIAVSIPAPRSIRAKSMMRGNGVASNDPSKPCRNQSAFNPCLHKQRAALLLSNGVIYAGFGGDGNRGALFAIDAKTLEQRAFWSSTPTGGDGGIWQSGQGPAADAAGNRPSLH